MLVESAGGSPAGASPPAAAAGAADDLMARMMALLAVIKTGEATKADCEAFKGLCAEMEKLAAATKASKTKLRGEEERKVGRRGAFQPRLSLCLWFSSGVSWKGLHPGKAGVRAGEASGDQGGDAAARDGRQAGPAFQHRFHM